MTERPIYAFILAGGSGTRLWPYSRRARPKQLLPLLGDQSLLQVTVARMAPLIPAERVWVLTSRDYEAAVREQLPELPAGQVLGEPSALGTAAAVGLGAALLAARDPKAIMAVLSADHLIEPEAAFLGNLVQAADVAADGWLVTFGIPPTGPDTGFGYVEVGDGLSGHAAGREVIAFAEKPDRPTAEAYLAGGRHLWNSGMFVWRVDTILAAYDALLPRLADRLREITALQANSPDRLAAGLEPIWDRIEDRTTVDYGILEHSERRACIPADFAWRDVGSWSALAEALAEGADERGNLVLGPPALLEDSQGLLVVTRGGRTVAALGVADLVIVDTPDALLVCRRDRAQDLKRIVARLEAEGADDLL